MSDTQSLAGKVALVTGGSGGIGAACARAFAGAGARVVVGYHRGAEKAQGVADGLAGDGHGILALDLGERDAIRGLADQVERSHGRTDILVNAGGFTVPVADADLDALTDEIFESVLIANVRGPFSVIREFAPMLKASGDGVVVNISSISGFTGSGSSVAYCAAKAALDTMTLSLARALGPAIRVLCVSPGAVATDFVAGRGREALEKIAAGTPLKKVVEPEDVADAVMACVTLLRASTGIRVPVDGGRFLV
ncbi:SDR family NAD(P)-dependent oxidoreductase [Sphingomonas bacterium]|uniref:SDR family NAD(P)-dependent oxidoreductase n=1 Tax=Sphingomonas bacterium TaxID=1895847 RepID=UPI0015753E8C|nr:SDR family oxidoreductase [Sphingomonas bacterium]